MYKQSGHRIQSICMEGFKSFKEKQVIDFGNADIVLLTGPNGAGKTSVVEALELAVTGDVVFRIGKPADSFGRLTTFCYSRAGGSGEGDIRAATIKVDWSGDTTTNVTIEKNGVVGGQPLVRELIDVQGSTLRAQNFLYSDSLGSILGMEETARKDWLDAFLLERQGLRSLRVDVLESERLRLIGLIQNQLMEVNEAELRDVAAARRVQDASPSLGSPLLTLLTKSGELSARHNLAPWFKEHLPGVAAIGADLKSLTPGDLEFWAMALERCAQDEDDRVRVEAEKHSAAALRWADLRQAIEAMDYAGLSKAFSSAECVAELGHLDTPELRDHKRAEALRWKGEAETILGILWSEGDLSHPNGALQRGKVGVLPLIAAWRSLARNSPEVALRIGLPAVAEERLKEIEGEEQRFWHTANNRRSEAELTLAAVKTEDARVESLQKQLELAQRVEAAWAAVSSDPVPLRDMGVLDLAKIRSEVHTQRSGGGEGRASKAKALRELGRCVRAWSALRQARFDAESRVENIAEWGKAQKRLEAVKELISFVGKLDQEVRKVHIQNRYEEPINRALRRVLASYAHRDRVREHLRVYFDEKNALRIAVGDHKHRKSSRGLMSLSRSQYTSAMMALALTTNLGQPDPQLGFVCLDDVSDALDLDNLAADAQLFRQLAYGKGRLRQLILTNHNDEITDRLVPRLLPPAGRSMRIIQLLPQSGDGDMKVEHWDVRSEPSGCEVKNGESPLKEIFPE